MRNSRCRALCYFALPAVLLVACVLQPSQASAETNSLGVDCSKIDVASLMMQDNMRAGLILIQCGIVQGGQPCSGQLGATSRPLLPTSVSATRRIVNSSANVCGSESMVAASTADKGQTIVVNYNANVRQRGQPIRVRPTPPMAGRRSRKFNLRRLTTPMASTLGIQSWFSTPSWASSSPATWYGNCGGHGIGLWTSKDGKNWKVGACAHNGGSDDRESMWADNEPTSGTYGRMYVSYNDYTTNCGAGGCLFVTYSDDGTTWSTPQQLNTSYLLSQRADHRLTARRQAGGEEQHGIHCQHG